MIAAEIDPRDIERIKRAVERGAKELNRSSVNLVRQAAIFAIQSAAKETGPDRASSPSKMKIAHKFRRIVSYKNIGYFSTALQRHVKDYRYGYKTAAGKTKLFPADKPISPKTLEKRGLRELKRNIEVWDRRKRATLMIPYLGTATTKYDKESKVGKIPHYGAAKVGWLKALGRLPGGKPFTESGAEWIPSPRVESRKSEDTYELEIENMTSYVQKISPNAAAIAMHKTANRMEKIIEIEINRMEKKLKW